MNITPKEVKDIVENFQEHIEASRELNERLNKSFNSGSSHNEFTMMKLEYTEEKLLIFTEGLKLIDSIKVKKGNSYAKQYSIRFRAKGMTYQSIGKLFGLTKERIRQILNEQYELIANELNSR